MNNIGSKVSSLLGGNNKVTKIYTGGDSPLVYRSPTTNSYNKCINALSCKFPADIISAAIKAVEKHDQNSFTETVTVNGTILHIKGIYKRRILAHLMTVEMSTEKLREDDRHVRFSRNWMLTDM